MYYTLCSIRCIHRHFLCIDPCLKTLIDPLRSAEPVKCGLYTVESVHNPFAAFSRPLKRDEVLKSKQHRVILHEESAEKVKRRAD